MPTIRKNNRLQSKPRTLADMDSRSRSPYVVKACEECRRRKIRCNGAQPCRRCSRLSLVCFTRAKRQHNSHPEQSLDLQNILAELNTLRADYEALATNSGHGSSTSGSPPPPSTQRLEALRNFRDTLLEDSYISDPLVELSVDEMSRLVRLYEEQVQFIYPLADMDSIENSAALLNQNRVAAHPEHALEEADAACLRLVLANAMAVDDRCNGSLPRRLYEAAQPYVSGLPEAERIDVKGLRAFVLVAQYFFMRDKVIAAWRNIGFAVRTAVELGLHLQSNVEAMFPQPRQRRSVQQLWWSIYILDHCWSLHWGLGPAVREVDPVIGITGPDDTMPFLRAMVDCTQIISRAWKVICPSVNQIDGNTTSLRRAQERLETVYREIREWQSSSAVSDHFYKQQNSLNWWQLQCLKTFLYLRANELCIFLCKPILVTRHSLAENRNTLEFATTLAKDSMSVLLDFNRTCSGMRVLPFVFNQFLSSALATLCLACIQEPHRYNTLEGDCRAPIQAAKELIEDLERSSFIHRQFYGACRELFALVTRCRIMGRDPFLCYDDDPEPTTDREFYNALREIEPLFGRVGHSM